MTLTLNGSSTGTGNQSYINLDNNHILRIQDASSNVLMFLHSAGLIALDADNTADVAIGSLSATEKLDVNGKIRMRTGATAGYVPVADADGVMTWTDPSTLSTDGTGALEEITDGANTGYRIVGRDPRTICRLDNAVDLSNSKLCLMVAIIVRWGIAKCNLETVKALFVAVTTFSVSETTARMGNTILRMEYQYGNEFEHYCHWQ